MATPNIVPRADSEGGLGTASKYWASAYIDVVYVGAGKVGRDADNALSFATDDLMKFRVQGATRAQLSSTYFKPQTNDEISLGVSGTAFSDLFLASGAVINFDSGNLTLTHSSNALTLADNDIMQFGGGGDLQIYHSGASSNINNTNGDLYISNGADDADLIFRSDDGSGGFGTYFFLDGSSASGGTLYTQFPDNSNLTFGSANDLEIKHDGTDSKITNSVGDLVIRNLADDKDIILQSDDGSGGVTAYLTLDGSAGYMTAQKSIKFEDSVTAYFGASNDLQIYHNGTDSHIRNTQDVGDLVIRNSADDKDLIFQCDDGNGSDATYFYLDGSSAAYSGGATTALYTNWPDNSRISLGTSHDLTIHHSGTSSAFANAVGHLEFIQSADGSDIKFYCDDGSGGITEYLRLDGGTEKVNIFKSTVFTGGGMDYGVDGTGADVIFYGDTAGRDMKWDQSEDHLLFKDNTKLKLGTSGDLQLYHDGSSTYIENGVGNLNIMTRGVDADMVFWSDDGSDGDAEYFRLDGGIGETIFSRNTRHSDSVYAQFGTGNDLQIYHDGSNSYISDSGTGVLYIRSGGSTAITVNGTAVTFSGTINGIPFFSDVATNSMYTHDVSATDSTASFNTAYGFVAMDAITTGDNNTAVGYEAGSSLTTGEKNVAIGKAALSSEDTGSRNIAIGSGALQTLNYDGTGYNVAVGYDAGVNLTTGRDNVLVGGQAGDSLTTGGWNIAIGRLALAAEDEDGYNIAIGFGALTTQNAGAAAYNIAIGHNAGQAITTGIKNTIIGGNAGDALTTGNENVAIGYEALTAEDTGGKNVAVGKETLRALDVGGDGYNVAVGFEAGHDMTTGVKNTLIGAAAGDALTEGHSNTAVGYESLSTSVDGDGNTAIGYLALRVYEDGDGNGNNTAVGNQSQVAATTGEFNTSLGALSMGTGVVTGDYNVAVGYVAGQDLTSGAGNTALGAFALMNGLTAAYNVAIGYGAMSNADGAEAKNVAIGYNAMNEMNNSADNYNVAVGYEAGKKISTGVNNTLIGAFAGDALTTGEGTVAIGKSALSATTVGHSNIAIGLDALANNVDGSASIAIGQKALEDQDPASAINMYNVAIGHFAGKQITTGTGNTILGGLAGDSITTGTHNVAIGYLALRNEDAYGHNVAVGHGALMLLDAAADAFNVAIGHEAGKATTTGIENTLIGSLAGDALTSGSRNTAIGYGALSAEDAHGHNVAVGRNALLVLNAGADGHNVAIGSSAGEALSTGVENTLIGYQAGVALTTGDNNIVIGNDAATSAVDVDNTTVIGTGSTTNAIIHGLRKTVVATATNIAAPRINNIHNFSDADGATVTLPDSGGGAYIGASFEFVCSIAATSNSHKIVCTDTTNELILGALTMVDTDTSDAVVGMAAEVDDSFSAVSFNGTTTGGRIGTKIKITNIAADKWFVEGTVLHSGSASTPFATS